MHVVHLGFSEPTGHRTGRGWARASEATVQESEHEGRAHGEGPSPHRPREKGSAMQMGAHPHPHSAFLDEGTGAQRARSQIPTLNRS